MKFTIAISVVTLLLPLISQAVVIQRDSEGALVARNRGGNRGQGGKPAADKGKKGNGGQGNGGQGNGGQGNGGQGNGGQGNGGQGNGGQGNGNGGQGNGGQGNGGQGNGNGGKGNGGKGNGGKGNGGKGNGGKGNGGKGNGGKGNGAGAPPPASSSGNGGGNDPQKSLTLDPSVIQSNLAQNGQSGTTEAGQVPSLTSTNNFINFCIGQGTLTNGQQVKEGSCNPTPMGMIVAQNKMPGAKFVSPKNGDTIKANTAFDIKLAVTNMETGNFVNPNTNYFAAPAQVNGQGLIIAHSHVTVQKLSSLDSTDVPDSTQFAFFKGLNLAAQGGVLTATVGGATATTQGLPAGAYRMCSINTAANHQPVLVAVAQHGSLDDCSYFTAA